MFRNLLRVGGYSMGNRAADADAALYIRMFFEDTKRCDKVQSMRKMRNNVSERLDFGAPGTTERILSHTAVPTDVDARNASEALLHYSTWIEEELISALDWRTKVKYQTMDRWDRFVGIAGVGVAGFAGARRL